MGRASRGMDVDASMPLMKWSTPLPMGSSGMRTFRSPVNSVGRVSLYTMSLAVQLVSKLQSDQER